MTTGWSASLAGLQYLSRMHCSTQRSVLLTHEPQRSVVFCDTYTFEKHNVLLLYREKSVIHTYNLFDIWYIGNNNDQCFEDNSETFNEVIFTLALDVDIWRTSGWMGEPLLNFHHGLSTTKRSLW